MSITEEIEIESITIIRVKSREEEGKSLILAERQLPAIPAILQAFLLCPSLQIRFSSLSQSPLSNPPSLPVSVCIYLLLSSAFIGRSAESLS